MLLYVILLQSCYSSLELLPGCSRAGCRKTDLHLWAPPQSQKVYSSPRRTRSSLTTKQHYPFLLLARALLNSSTPYICFVHSLLACCSPIELALRISIIWFKPCLRDFCPGSSYGIVHCQLLRLSASLFSSSVSPITPHYTLQHSFTNIGRPPAATHNEIPSRRAAHQHPCRQSPRAI